MHAINQSTIFDYKDMHKRAKYKVYFNILGYLDKMGDENLLKGSYWTFRVITFIIWAAQMMKVAPNNAALCTRPIVSFYSLCLYHDELLPCF